GRFRAVVAEVDAREFATVGLAGALEGGEPSRARSTLDVDARVDRDPVDPARELRVEPELADLPKHHPEGLVGCVEGVRGVAGDPEADVVDPVLVLLVEIPEGSLEPGDRGRLARLDESAIGIVPQRMLLFLMGETDSRTRRFPIRTSPIRFFPPPLTPWMHT